ncbi:hypothetical protein K443DRAFT_684809 [Laccaria amethystina LaAM-08-1]|uniref:Uncharacterized protein n=1 Tax=Laccaria amethystina LaAM-08-1 TaxID=1095629 RepID=A0A0C9WIJ7_9AGAR|nr:hypothetical protein K443DRAFT_684809 [Laccaria amethystina LaAM-08-1]
MRPGMQLDSPNRSNSKAAERGCSVTTPGVHYFQSRRTLSSVTVTSVEIQTDPKNCNSAGGMQQRFPSTHYLKTGVSE